MQSPLLTLLRRLEAQNIWRVTYNALPQQQQYNTSSAQHHVDEPQQDLPQVRFGLTGAAAASIAQEWYHDESVSVQEALKLLVTRIQTSGPVKQHHLQALYQRCKTGDELDRALKLTRLNYLARGALQQHAPFSHRTSKTLVQQAMQLGVPELAARALEHSAEFGLPADSVKEATPLLIYYSKQGDLLKMLEVYEVIKRQGRHPGPDVCYVLVKGCVDWGRADLARLIIKEFEAAGVRTRQGTLAYLNRRPSMGIESALPTAAEFAGALTDDGAVVERNAARA